LVVAPDWVSLAASADNPKSKRLAALRGLAAMGDGARQHGKDLRALLESTDADIRADAYKTLLALRDPSVVMVVAENCRPSGAAFFEMPLESFCLSDIAVFGEEARSAGAHVMKFLASPNAEEVSRAVSVLGYIGYDPATPQIEQQLRSPDWRVVYSAARSLGWLGATGAIPELERVAADHWLPEVRAVASRVVDALKGTDRKLARAPWPTRPPVAPFVVPSIETKFFFVGGDIFGGLPSMPPCHSGRWAWRGVQFAAPPVLPYSRAHRTELALGSGRLVGVNKGEWGGDLTWQPDEGQPQLLHKHNVVAIEPAEGGAIVLFGLAHMGLADGYAVHVSQRADGGWSLTEVARMPSRADALATIGPNLYAAWSANRVVVFSDKGILGLAGCVAP
jgi:hypothetical protein